MTTDPDERRLDAEFQAHLENGTAYHVEPEGDWSGWRIQSKQFAGTNLPALDITTAEGREQAVELLRQAGYFWTFDKWGGWTLEVSWEDGQWHSGNRIVFWDEGRKAGSIPEAIIAAWRSARDAWRESND